VSGLLSRRRPQVPRLSIGEGTRITQLAMRAAQPCFIYFMHASIRDRGAKSCFLRCALQRLDLHRRRAARLESRQLSRLDHRRLFQRPIDHAREKVCSLGHAAISSR
jgi:hypothetical protein